MNPSAPFPSARLRTARADAAHLAALLGTEHSAMADFILALAAFDASRGWAELGHTSLFAFLVRHLRLSKSAAYHRAAAARLIRDHALVADALRSGQLCLSSAAELAKVLTAANEAEVLPRFCGLSAREAREVVAALAPHPNPPQREVIRAMAPAIPSEVEGVLTSEPTAGAFLREVGASSPGAPPPAPHVPPNIPAPLRLEPTTRPADETVPLTADLRRLHVTVSRRFLKKLEAARELRSHARSNATTEALLEEALDLLIAREEKRRTPATKKPRRLAPADSANAGVATADEMGTGQASPQEPGTSLPPAHRGEREHVPAHICREVWIRDEGRCQWPLDDGTTCGSTHRLQLDHALAAARGGPPTVANLRILCEAHNKEAARRVFGAGWMSRRLREESA